MKAGDIIFVRGSGPLANIIKYFDKGKFSHVCIAVSDTEIFEAQYGTKTHIIKMEYNDYETIPLNLNQKEIGKLQLICKVMEGKWYDYEQILGYVLQDFFHVDETKFNNPNDLICSEAVAIILYLLDKLDKPLINATPNELYKIISDKIKH